MQFKVIADYFDKLEKISSRLQLTALLSDLLSKADKENVDKVIYIIQGKLWPDFLGYPELGIGEKFLIKAISIATNVKESEVEGLNKKLGDLGEVARMLKSKQQSSSILSFLNTGKTDEGLSLEETYSTLSKIALTTGEGSRDLKIRLLAGLLKKADPLEAKFLVRFVEGRLRVGIGDATIIDALAIAFGGGQNNSEIIERAYNVRADLGNIAKILMENGIEALKTVKPEAGIPIRPMLAERLSDPEEILKKVGGLALVDYKYDGERAQIHKDGNKIYIFSRRLENITSQYPDVVDYISEFIDGDKFIIEGEIVAIDPESGEIRPFQELMHRKRKSDIHEAIKSYPVNVFLFDLMLYNDEDYTNRPLQDRRKILEAIVKNNDKVKIANHIMTDNVNVLKQFFYQAISDGTEGVMVKSLSKDSIYQAGARGWLWIKLKRDYQSEMADTVDLVVIGGFYGKGKRGGKLSSLLMAAYNPSTDTFDSVCKVASGFSDEQLDDLQKKLNEIKRQTKHPRVNSKMEPDVWVEPLYVAEIIGAEITLSPLHSCCQDMIAKDSGLSIRFPRFIRWREDKGPEDATTTEEILEMYKRQLKKKVDTSQSEENANI
ncbi:ATP-dependent DNA ligase [Sulfolobus sp. A20]|uniref:ATP-dependent DNA ligase n=2 Tax=Sulfolobaceae TaxID=118883 RepID=UPI000846015D|nr:ATP-dependent DNA ligase [Sulfolobus sp. A20]TRM74823.1 ATP-dependent DNA ligase [Sulfolobus sp. A20-N-F8]TRM83037.1 ATP-dependent DNA ligase [Sulfolobus sp. A20-N-F6]TRM87863.1 ATP-dependent DNA ligase [Sulfolobus sp. C3]TRN01831.1 ATP-dependent DNA ligase [Sulfolobus sp. E1]AOL16192.1 ATP-dependent DNA ligase [Sulfolobus sp. A20]